MSNTPFKMKGWSAFTKKIWPPGSEPFDVEKDVIEKESGKVEKYTEEWTKKIQEKLMKNPRIKLAKKPKFK